MQHSGCLTGRSAGARETSRWRGSRKQSHTESLNQVRRAIGQAGGSLAAIQGAAETIQEILNSSSLNIILLDKGQYWDVIQAGTDLSPGQVVRHGASYSAPHYPIATILLRAHGGYLGTECSDVIQEYRELWPGEDVGSIMGAALVADATTSGEIFVMRESRAPDFTGDDLSSLRDLATIFAVRLPLLLAANDLERQSWTVPTDGPQMLRVPA